MQFQNTTKTGRRKSQPNLQNIPVRTKEGAEIRDAFLKKDKKPSKKAPTKKAEGRRRIKKEEAPKGTKAMELVLQVRCSSFEEWGTIATRSINLGTTHNTMRQFSRELENLKYGWINANYFPGGASYQIVERVTYYH